jgi:hypothetical protein
MVMFLINLFLILYGMGWSEAKAKRSEKHWKLHKSESAKERGKNATTKC